MNSTNGILTNDITEQKVLSRSEAIMRAIVETALSVIITIDDKGIILSCNPVVERLFHYKPEELIGVNIKILMPEPYRSEHDGYLLRYLTEGKARVIGGVVGREVVGLRKNGSTFPVSLAVSAIKIDGECQFVGILTDITEQKMNEDTLLEYSSQLEESVAIQKKQREILQRSEATVRAIVDTALSVIITIDDKGIILSCNPVVERLFHYKPEELIGVNIKILMPEPYHSAHDGYLLRYLTDGKPRVIGSVVGREVEGLRKGGSTFPVNLAVAEIKVEGVRQFVGILTDMTEQKMNEDTLLEYSLHLEELVAIHTAEVRAIVQSAVNGIVTIDARGLIDEFNPAAELMFGYKKNEVHGKNITVLMPEPYSSEHDGYLHNFFTTGIKKIIGIGREVIGRRKDGSTFPMYLAVGHTVLLCGKNLFVGFVSDITEQKLNQKRLAEAKEAAEAGIRIKSAFVANMSHEIRTPMNAILGFSEVILQDSTLSPDSLRNARTIFSASKSLLGIINDVLDVSKMESGKFSLESVCFNLYNVLNDSIRTIESKAVEKELMLSLEFDSTLPIRFMGDPTRLRQVILNLVGNSIKFTESGSVKLVVKAGEKANMLHFSILDTGIGMTTEQVASVFDVFSQADVSITRRFGGTGLGTSISKQIVESMGGEIWVDSVFGEGTTFHFTAHLPVATNIDGSLFEDWYVAAKDYVSLRTFNVLLAEDIDANAELVTLRLKQQGHKIHWVKNGREAVDAFKNGDYDLILMDIQMPELDGLSAAREIRALELAAKNGKRIAILALTANVLHEEKNSFIDAGMDAVVNKPIEFSELFSTMEKIIPAGVGTIQTVKQIETNVISTIDFSPLDGVIAHEKGQKKWGDAMIYGKALKAFAQEHGNDADKMATFLHDDAQIRQISHSLNGLSGNLALIEVPIIAREIETAVKLNQKENLDNLLSQLKVVLNLATTAIDKLQLPDEQKAIQSKPFDKKEVSELFRLFYRALEELNPDAIEPIFSSLSAYLDEKELSKIRHEIDNFDFDEAANQANALVKKLELTIE